MDNEMKMTHRSDELKKALMTRLKRIEGQVRGLEQMLEKEAYCNDILQQSAAVRSAIDGFNQELLANHIRGCVSEGIAAGDTEVIDELVKTIRKLMK